MLTGRDPGHNPKNRDKPNQKSIHTIPLHYSTSYKRFLLSCTFFVIARVQYSICSGQK